MLELHVSPAGDDSAPGTPDEPFATIDRARRAAREATGDVIVHLGAGTHVLTEPLALDPADRRIAFQAAGYGTADQEAAVISGGREISGWQVHDGVWRAEVGDLDTRHLYADGRRAERAGIDGIPGDARRTPTGYVTDSRAPLAWQPGVEFVYRGVYPWTEARCGVAAVAPDGDSTAISMRQPAFGWALELYRSAWDGEVMDGPGLPTRVENDLAFLTEPGTFVLDRSRPGQHVLHYLPRPDEDPQRTRVVAPVLETLLHATGVRDISFRGLVFADATWLRPGGDRGFLHYHGNNFYDGGGVEEVVVVEGQSWVTVPSDTKSVPAGVVLDDATGIRFEGCRFTRLGAGGLSTSGGSDITVRGCDFDTLGGAGISISESRQVLVEDNLVRQIGLDHSGSPGISLAGTTGCTVAHNHVTDVPHCGIVAGPAGGTRIERNLVTRTMGVLADGGGVYVSGPQGDSHDSGATVSGNVIEDTRTPYNFGLYTDYGASWVTVEDNVVVRADSTAVLHVSPPLENVRYRNNFWDADPLGSDSVPDGVTYEDNTTIADEDRLRSATAHIRDRAGRIR
ncbi:Right handed beta helix region [Saccharopolyspora antimicrobica]|uniref:Parallel beta helix pectate lyase-like protein n=1 Tax=Saccharopolyspora antimicrobica TaxID=455193 RepID=A0A1I5EJB4_9PSEU|nr:parallel beta helix pectate lyase-like protein [Saccharopolyspora antimicrobica]SFO11426.1 Right handed beta helix region [Saccharopolyspora antimicrobica]